MLKFYTANQIIQIATETVAVLPSQAEYLRDLATILSGHLRRASLIEQGFEPCQLPSFSALIVAPTGTGKTYLLQRLTGRLGINLIVLDCSSLAREGWKGTSIAQRIIAARESVDTEVFASSIVYLDEFDKLRNWGNANDQGSPVDNLLKLMEEPTVTAEVNREIITVDIRKMTFLFGGAFQNHDLVKIIANRVSPKAVIGFSAESRQPLNDEALLCQVTMEDIAAYGFPMELCGRIGTILTIGQLSEEDYRQLLTSPNDSALSRYNTYLRRSFGVTLDITDGAVTAICQQAMAAPTGARSITPLVRKLMCRALPQVETDVSISKVVLDEENGSCFVRYVHGSRLSIESTHVNPFDSLFQSHEVERIASQLCDLSSKTNSHQPLPELEAFLTCALFYLCHFSLPEDFCWSSLEKLANTLPHNDPCPTWDILMEDAATSSHPQAEILMGYYQTFILRRNNGTAQRINKTLAMIRHHVSLEV